VKAGAPRALCLAGPTASGKSAVALAFAESMRRVRPVEIVSVDSAQVYRGMDIGTAKPSAAERAAVPHHLIDLRDPAEAYSAAAFAADARRAIDDIHARGHLPLLVGGTMLYFKALREGLDEMPAGDATLRATLEARAAAEGWPALHAELARVDPASAARIKPGDAQRIERALEVWLATGKPLSAWQAGARPADAQRYPLLALEPASRGWLHQRIAARLDAMFEAGFVAEVQALRARTDLKPSMPSLRCVGYRQLWQALDDGALGQGRAEALAATRQLAKRQLTWLRSWADRTGVACDAASGVDEATGVLRRWATRPG
jgi:tRNA dimethylallyltransferase